MRLVVVLAWLALASLVEAGQPGEAAPPSADHLAEAYRQFLLAQRYESAKDIDAAVAAYEHAMTADPGAAAIPAALADLQMRAGRLTEAVASARRSLEIDANDWTAHRVLGLIHASAATKDMSPRSAADQRAQRDNLDQAMHHLERATAGVQSTGPLEANLRDTLARIYMIGRRYEAAIPLLADLARRDPQRTDIARLLVEAYASAGRPDEAVRWLEEAIHVNPQLQGTLGDFHARHHRWTEAAAAYEEALRVSPRAFDVRTRYGSMLLSAGGPDNAGRARDVLGEAVALRPGDERGLYLLVQAERVTGNLAEAEAVARRLIDANPSAPRGYASLAEVLADAKRDRDAVDMLLPVIEKFRQGNDPAFPLGLLLPRLASAYQRLDQPAAALGPLEELRALTPRDPSAANELIRGYLLAGRYDAAVEAARAARTDRPDDVWLARLESEALRRGGRSDEAIAVLDALVSRRGDDPEAHVALASAYAQNDRSGQALQVLRDAQTRFPADTSITFELGAVLERRKQYVEAEAAFRDVIGREPAHAPALNYLGYMLAERGERLDESVELIKRALEVEPDNGSYLDSLGWAYFKSGRFELAEVHLRQAAERLSTSSVVHDHFGDVLFELQRYREAIAAWERALGGDGESIEREAIERKIRTARQRLDSR